MTVERPPIAPLKREFAISCHTPEQLDVLKRATLDILESVGVKFPSARALDILAEHGCAVDRGSQIVKFPPQVVLDAMAAAPRYFGLGARDPVCDLQIRDDTTYCTTDGCGTEVVDWQTGVQRRSTKADLARITRLQDYLSSIAFWWPTVSAGDCGETAQLHEIDVGFNNTVKHLQGMVNGEREARYAVEMATVIAGDADELRRRPVLSDLIGTISPLVQDEDGIEGALVFAEAGVPVTFVTMPTLGTTAPATRAGAFAVGAAELVSATVLLQLAFPGAPVAHSIMQSYADPRTGGLVSFPLDGRCRFLATEVAHHWGVPSEAACCGTDAETSGTWQAAVEDGMDLALFAWEGSDLAPSIGLIDVYTVFTPEELILGDDIYHRARYGLLDMDFGDEALALDAVAAVGPGGHYLGQKHTRKHLRTSFVPAITHQVGPDGSFRDPVEVAREKALWIDENYGPVPLQPDKAAELTKILAVADAELRG
jgi:trimethylamine--corrinoid protein Co-methyltransferase